MKKIYLFIIVSVISFSCSDKLELIPQNSVTEGTFWQNSNDAITAVNGVYAVLQNDNLYGSFFIHNDALTDNAYSQYSFLNYLEISEGIGFDSNSPLPRGVWNTCYQGIVRANRVLENIPLIDMNETLRSRLSAEARFIRALLYFHLTNLWGDVPLVTSIQTISESLIPRSSKQEVISLILEDINFAASTLPESYSSSETGRVTKAAAYALLCRVQLYNKNYSASIAAANQVSKMGFGLVSAEDFSKMFIPDLENKNVESIWEVQFLSQTGEGLGSGYNGVSGAMAAFGAAQYSPVQELVNIYDGGDIRLPATVLQPGESFGGEEYLGTNSVTNLAFIKHIIPDGSVTADGDANFVAFRYAEILLNLAESENELNGPVGAYQPINTIRRRAGLGDLEAGLSQGEMRDAIKLERRKELAFEGQHYFDLLRYGAADLKAAMESVTSVPNSTRVFQDRFVLWPIPQSELNINPNLTQNPGW